MKKIITSCVLMLLFGSLAFSEDYTLVKRLQIGPGTIYSYYEEDTRPWKIHLAEIDLTNPFITLESVKAQDKLKGFEKVSSMSSRNNSEGHRVVMGVNGDFYNTSNGIPVNNQVSNGEFVIGYTSWGTAFSYSEGGIPNIFTVQFSGKVISKNGSGNDVSYPLNSVNTSRAADQLVIYNNFYVSSTGTSSNGYECLARAISDWYVNDTVYAIIEACEDSVGNMTIPEGKFVLSGQGGADDFLYQNCHVGDTVRVIQKLANSPERLTQMVGGGAWFLQNGVDVISPSDVTRHPRTGVGYSADLKTLYFMVVDGRSLESIGMDYHHMGDFLKFAGAWHALNLDGGGSSTFVVRNSVMNVPSDGDQRSVSNSMLCISSAPSGPFSQIQTAQDSFAVYKNKSVDLDFSGWDDNFNLTALPDWSQLSVEYDTNLGTFDSNIFSAAEADGDTYVKVAYGEEKDSVLVHIIELYDIAAYPDTVTIDSVNSIKYEVIARDEHGYSSKLSNDLFTYAVLDPSLAEIDDEGRVIGKQTGETDVVIAYGHETDTVHVIIQIGEGEVVVDEIENISGWSISGDSYINMSATSMNLVDRTTGTGTKAVKVDYERTGDEDGMISIACDPINIYGMPSYILVDVWADSQKNWIYIDLEDARGVDYSVKCSSSLKYNDGYRTQYLEMDNLLPADGDQLYPLKLTGIRLRIDDKATSGSMFIDRIRLTYPGWTSISEEPGAEIPETHQLGQNYPNPFNPNTAIDYQLSAISKVNLSIYDVKGKRVATLVNGAQDAGVYTVNFDASMLPGGVYLYKLQAGNWSNTKKMLLIK